MFSKCKIGQGIEIRVRLKGRFNIKEVMAVFLTLRRFTENLQNGFCNRTRILKAQHVLFRFITISKHMVAIIRRRCRICNVNSPIFSFYVIRRNNCDKKYIIIPLRNFHAQFRTHVTYSTNHCEQLHVELTAIDIYRALIGQAA